MSLLSLLTFLALIAIGTLVVGGWFFITRGWTETLPDGREIRKGKIFRGWYFFWMKETAKPERIYYTGAQLKILYKQFKLSLGKKFSDLDLVIELHDAALQVTAWRKDREEKDKHILVGVYHQTREELMEVGESLGFRVHDKSNGFFALYKEFPAYRFPELVRHPLASCATCFASLYGSMFYWASVGIFAVRLPILALLFCWICFCLSLAVTLTAVAKKYN